MRETAQSVWNNCLEFIKDNIQPQAYKTWFEPILAVKLQDNALSIQVPSKFFYEWLEEHYVKILKVALTKELGADAISVDWTLELEKVRRKIGDKVAIQGNLDPTVLYADPSFIKREARKVLESFGKGQGHIFNLGHGILPDIDPENLKVLVNYVKEESRNFH